MAPSITQHDASQFLPWDGHTGEAEPSRFRRHLSNASSLAGLNFNTSLVQPVQPGLWFIALYNDDVVHQDVAISLTLTDELATPCPEDCNGRGRCLSGKCVCRDGFAGTDCSTSTSSIALPCLSLFL